MVLQLQQWCSMYYYSHIPTLLDYFFVTNHCYNGDTAATISKPVPAHMNESFEKRSLEKKPIGAIHRYA